MTVVSLEVIMDHDCLHISVLLYTHWLLPFFRRESQGLASVGFTGMHMNQPDCNKELEINIREVVLYSILHLYIEIFNFFLSKSDDFHLLPERVT